MKKALQIFLKGIAIGIAMIVPGVSGGTLAVLLGIYSDLIDAINGIFKHFTKSLKVLIPVALGGIIGFIGLVFPIKLGLQKCPLIIISLFAGLIIGGIPQLYKKVKGKESLKGFSLTFISILIMVAICIVSKLTTASIDLSHLTFGLWMYLLLAGIIVSIALVVPGISGSMTMMCLGLYAKILDTISELIKFNNIGHNISVLLPIVIGAIGGFFLISFIMGRLLKTHETGTYFSILGFVIGSIGTIFFLTFTSTEYPVTLDAVQISISVVLLVLGFLITFFVERFVSKKSNDVLGENNEVR